MEKKFASNQRKLQAIIAMILSILFIFTALSNPIIANAYEPAEHDGSGRVPASIPYVVNLNMYESNEEDASTNEEAGYLCYAASGDRCGVMFYVIDDRAHIQAIGVILDEKGTEKYDMYHTYANDSELDDAIDAQRASGVEHPISNVSYVPNVSPVLYSGGWTSVGSDVMNYLTSDAGFDISINGVPMPCPRWADYVRQVPGGGEALKRLSEPNTKWQVIVEPVSVNYLYTEDTFPSDVEKIDNVVAGGGHQSFAAGSPVPLGSWQGERYLPRVFIGTARNLLKQSNNIEPGGSQYTYKFYNKQFPYSICLSNDIEVPIFVGGGAAGYRTIHGVSLSGAIPRLSSNISIEEGIGLASIEISAISLPPIHTFDGRNTPGNTEDPDTDEGKNGPCTIKKLYYTETLYQDGTVKEDADPQYRYFERVATTETNGTTAYVSIDEEEGYEIELWKRSTENATFRTKEDMNDIHTNQSGTSSGIQRLMQMTNGNDKYLYILYKKVVVLDEEESEHDFELQESQVTKRVKFAITNEDGTSHSFSWTSPAHSPTSCSSHGGYGHHLNCSTEWDVAPVTGVAHNHAASGETSYYDCGYSYSCPTGCTINHTHHTHVNTDAGCLGYKKLKHTTLCSATCTTNHTHHYTHNINSTTCYEVCTKVWDVAPVTGVAHTHVNSCYDTPCSTFAFTDATIKLGIKLDQTSVNKAVVARKNTAVYNAPTVDIIQSNTNFGEFTRTNSGADTQSKSNFNFVTVLFRGNDKLTLADWKNNATTKSYLTNIAYDSNYNFKSANTPQGTRKAGEEYTETTGTKFINSSLDNQTTYKATVGAHGTCGSTKSYTFTKADGTSSDYTIQDIKVNIKVFWANGIGPASSGSLPSTQVAGSASFYPYIRMRYDNNTQDDVKVYVLGQRKRTVTVYDYASVSISGGDSKLAINSSQWSTHAKAQQNILAAFSGRTLTAAEQDRVKSSVLPGGATLSIAAHSNDTRQINVVTIQAYLAGNGLTHVENTEGEKTLPTDRSQLEARHESLASSVASRAASAYITQYITTGAKLNVSDMSGAQVVSPNQPFNGNGTTFSNDSKYHFNRFNDTRLNTNLSNPSYDTYTFFVNTRGEIRCVKNNTSPSEGSGRVIAEKGSDTITGGTSTMRFIAEKTGIVTALRMACVDNEGNDTDEGVNWVADGKWYNEAFDGVTYLYGTSTINVGIWDPLERTTVLDPKETPSQANKGDFFTSFNSSYFQSTINGGPTVTVGTFVNSNGQSRTLSLNFGNLYTSDVFYIPNVTTQDLK